MESKSLLIGESADPKIVTNIRAALNIDERVLTVNEITTLHMGPEFIVVTVSVGFVETLSAGEVEKAVTRLTRSIKAVDPRVKRIFIEAERQQDHRV